MVYTWRWWGREISQIKAHVTDPGSIPSTMWSYQIQSWRAPRTSSVTWVVPNHANPRQHSTSADLWNLLRYWAPRITGRGPRTSEHHSEALLFQKLFQDDLGLWICLLGWLKRIYLRKHKRYIWEGEGKDWESKRTSLKVMLEKGRLSSFRKAPWQKGMTLKLLAGNFSQLDCLKHFYETCQGCFQNRGKELVLHCLEFKN